MHMRVQSLTKDKYDVTVWVKKIKINSIAQMSIPENYVLKYLMLKICQ